MADLKISALTASTTPLAGTEVLPIVQSSATVKVSVANLTAGRAVTMLSNTMVSASAVNDVDKTGGASYAYRVKGNDQANTRFRFENTGGQLYELVGGNPGASNSGWAVYDATAAATRLYLDSSGNWTVNTGNLVIGTSGKGIDFSATPGTGTSELLADYEEGTWTPADGSGAGLSFTSVEGSYTKVGRLVTCFFSLTFPSTASGTSARISGLPFTVPAGTSGLNDAIFTVNTSGLVIQPYATNNATNFAMLLTYTGSGATNVQLTTAVLRGSITYSV